MASTYVKSKHDIAIQNVGTAGAGTDVIGMMLAQDRGVPIYRELDGRHLADQFFTGIPDQTFVNPEEELPLGQSSWRSGFGLEIYDPNDTERYFSSIGMDMRWKGMMITGPKSNTVTLPTGLSAAAGLTNTDFELAANWTGGARDSVAREGTYGWKVNVGLNAYQDAATWTTDWQSKKFWFTCWVRATNVGELRLAISDKAGSTTYGDYNTVAANTWSLISVSATLAADATRLRCMLHNDSGTVDNWFDACTLSSPATGVIKCFAEFNDELYIGYGQILAKLNGSGTGFDLVESFPSAITDLEPFTDSRLYIAQGKNASDYTANDYWQMTTGEVISRSNLINSGMQFLKTVHSSSPTMWGNDSVNKIRSTSNPSVGGSAWSAQKTVDSNYNSITNLLSLSGALYIMKENRPYYLDSSSNVQDDLAPILESLAKSTDNGKNAFFWLNNLYMNWGTQALLENDGSTNTWRNPADYITNLSDFNGQVFALAGDDRYLYAILDNSTKIEVLAGRLETIGSTTSWVWHPIHELTLTGCETAFVSSVYQKRLWLASTASGDSLYYIALPTGYGDIVNDANRDFLTSTEMITSYLHGNFKLTDKAFIKIQVVLGHAYDVDIYFECHYQKLGDSAWTDAGDLKGTSTNRSPILYIPVDASSNNPISTMMRFKFVAKTDDVLKTPQGRSFNVTALLYPIRKQVIAARIRCAEEIILKDGTVERNMYDTIKTTMDNAKDATWPVSIRDIDGNTKDVKFLPLSGDTPRFEIIRDEKGREMERWYSVMMQIIPLS